MTESPNQATNGDLGKQLAKLENEIEVLRIRLRRRDEMDLERKSLKKFKFLRELFTLGLLIMTALILGLAWSNTLDSRHRIELAKVEIERTRVETERLKLQRETELQSRRLEIELENAAWDRKVRTLRLVTAILSGPGTVAEKKSSVQLLLDLQFDLGEFSKSPGKLLDLIDRGLRIAGSLTEVIRGVSSSTSITSPESICCGLSCGLNGCCPSVACVRHVPPKKPPAKPPVKKCSCSPNE